jgi:DNA-binding IscR family transcriptional regulator
MTAALAHDSEPDVFSKQFIVLVEALVNIARNDANGQRSIAREIVPSRHLASFRALSAECSRRNILKTRDGLTGGMSFLVDPSELSVGDVARIVKTFSRENWNGDRRSSLPLLNSIRARMIAEMDTVTIADLVRHPDLRPNNQLGGAVKSR